MNEITVSILMTAYNAENYIAEAIESVLQSHYKLWELIILDDNSSDGTFKIIEKFALNNSMIRVYKNETNLGDYPNRNKAASYATGKYLKYIDNDDVLYKYSLNYMVEAMEKYPEAALAIGFNQIDDNTPYPIYNSSQQTYNSQFLGKSFLGYGPSAAIIKRDSFEQVGGFLEKDFVGDQELWLRLALEFPVIKLQPSLIWYRVHPVQESNRERKNIFNNDIRFKINLECLEKGKHLLTETEYKNAKKKQKQHYSRFIMRHIFKNKKISEGYILYKKSKLSFYELLQGFKSFIK